MASPPLKKAEKKIVGWREWISIPGLHVSRIKAKLDTGARTSSLHAFDLETLEIKGKQWVKFKVHPYQRNDKIIRRCLAPIFDYRWVKSSSGHREKRFVILTELHIFDDHWPIELTLTNRDEMGFRMLLGRTAMHKHLIVDSSRSYCNGKLLRKKLKKKKSLKQRISL